MKNINTSRLRKNRVKKSLNLVSRPQVLVRISNRHIYAQLIDTDGRTLVGATTINLGGKKSKILLASDLATVMAEKIKATGINAIVLNRGSRLYHGRIKEFADGLRKNGVSL